MFLSSNKSSSLSTTSIATFAIGLVIGSILGFLISSLMNPSSSSALHDTAKVNGMQNVNNVIASSSRSISSPCPSLPTPISITSCENQNNQQVLEKKADNEASSEDEEAQQLKSSSSSSSSSPCTLAFQNQLTSTFLAKNVVVKNPPVSIIKGGSHLPTTPVVFASRNNNDNDNDEAHSSTLTTKAIFRHRSFQQIGDEMQDDKTYLHRFDRGYEAYLGHPAVRGNSKQLSIFELGMGCNQHKGVGASVKLWGEYLPDARLVMLEYDEKCAKEWPEKEENRKMAPKGGFVVYPGDQGKAETWKRVFSERNEGPNRMYDMIIDDASHINELTIFTFMNLWKHLKPGGVYVIEDINTSWKTRYGGTKRMMPNSKTVNNFVKILMDRVHSVTVASSTKSGVKADEDVKMKSSVHRVDCMHFICFISKKW